MATEIVTLSGQLPVFINYDHATPLANAVLRTDPSGTGTIDIRLSNEHVTAIIEMMADGYQIIGLSFIYVNKEN